MGTRVVLIVGASSGIGRACAHRCAARGDRLVLVARGKGALEDAADECRSRGAAAVTVQAADVRDQAAVHELIEAVLREHGRIDAVVHAAGVVAYGNFLDVPAEIFDAVQDTNLRGAANVARAVLPVLRRQEQGHLVLVGSLLGDIAAPSMTAYVVSKHAVAALGRQLAIENRDRSGVHISVVSPGSVDTPIYRQAATYSGRAGRPPAPVGRPETVARAIVLTFDRPRDRVSVGVANALIRTGFRFTPRLFDALVGPIFRAVATRPGRTEDSSGNVLAPVEELAATRGGENQGLRDLMARLGGR